MSEVRDGRLFIWPKLSKDDPRVLAARKAVEELALSFPVKPFWYEPGASHNVERVLVLADGFEHSPIVDFVYPKKPALMREAVEWSLGLRESRGARLAMDAMTKIFGEGLTLRERKEERDEFGEWRPV